MCDFDTRRAWWVPQEQTTKSTRLASFQNYKLGNRAQTLSWGREQVDQNLRKVQIV